MQQEQARGERNRQRIVEVADRLFYEQGYNSTSFSDIAREAEIPRGNFYYYFKSKDDILEGVIERRIEEMREQLAQWRQTLDDPRERLLAAVRMMLGSEDSIIRYGCPWGTLNAELAKRQPALQARAASMFDVLVEWYREQFTELAVAEPRTMALHLMARMQGASMVANVYTDRDFLRYEINEIERWLTGIRQQGATR